MFFRIPAYLLSKARVGWVKRSATHRANATSNSIAIHGFDSIYGFGTYGARRREIDWEKDDGLRSLSFTHPTGCAEAGGRVRGELVYLLDSSQTAVLNDKNKIDHA